MKLNTPVDPVKAGKPGLLRLWDTEVELSPDVMERLEAKARAEGVTPEAMAIQCIKDTMIERLSAEFKERMGFAVEDLNDAILHAGREAVLTAEEVPIPLHFCLVPHGKLPLFVDEDTVRAMRGLCEAAEITADQYADEWFTGVVDQTLEAGDLSALGMGEDLLDQWGPEGKPFERESPEWEARKAALQEAARRENERRAGIQWGTTAPGEGGEK